MPNTLTTIGGRLAVTSVELYGDLGHFSIAFASEEELEEAKRAYERLGCKVEPANRRLHIRVLVEKGTTSKRTPFIRSAIPG